MGSMGLRRAACDGLDGACAFCLFLEPHRSCPLSQHFLYRGERGDRRLTSLPLRGRRSDFFGTMAIRRRSLWAIPDRLRLGGILGVSAVLLRREVILAMAGAIFVAEALSVILQVLSYRYRNKKRIFLCAPLHHHFEYKGWPETKVVIRFWIISLLFAIIAVASLKLQ